MPNEIEAKIRVEDFAPVRAALDAAGAELAGTAVVSDTYFDTPDRRLLAGDSGLRVRQFTLVRGHKGADLSARVTYKGPRDRSAAVKVRHEIEFAVGDGEAAEAMFEALGYRPTIRIDKRRTTYRLAGAAVELDELPHLGLFVEIEAPTVQAVEQVRGLLGLAGPVIMEGYTHMADAYCRQHNLSPLEAMRWNP